ncbi:hypothetical protein CDAR_192171 [Caerostris darwini]|uniref:Uncharacterized protein n=1 Tax=Caerostris darwini TaxID=1538125 RepID=A0AAV4PIA0_9ARAC|nr:hypothetical protein CDAR_192171 [Caerostris darwini]
MALESWIVSGIFTLCLILFCAKWKVIMSMNMDHGSRTVFGKLEGIWEGHTLLSTFSSQKVNFSIIAIYCAHGHGSRELEGIWEVHTLSDTFSSLTVTFSIISIYCAHHHESKELDVIWDDYACPTERF